MSRKKAKAKGKSKGSAKNTPHRTPARRHALHPEATPTFSLMDEARHTGMSSHHTAASGTGKKLRQMPIQFVSAGHLEGTIKERLCPTLPGGSETGEDSSASSSHSPTQENTQAMAHLVIRSPSPPASDTSSSSDEVVFKGRGLPSQEHADSPHAAQAVPRATSRTNDTTEEPTAPASTEQPTRPHAPSPRWQEIRPTSPPTATVTDARTATTEPQRPASVPVSSRSERRLTSVSDDSTSSDGVLEDTFAKRRAGRPEWESTTTSWEHRSKPNIGWLPVPERPNMEAFLRSGVTSHDAAMHDYMQNMEEYGLTDGIKAAAGFAHREMDLDAASYNDWESASGSQFENEDLGDGAEAQDNDSWDSDMLRDLVDLSTSSDVMDTIVRILSKRTRRTGLQYLCVYEGSATDEAHWLPATFLKNGSEKKLVRAFEEEACLQELESSDSESMDDGEEKLDDETIARVLQKQEELGLGSDELILCAGDEYFGGPINTKQSYSKLGNSNRKQTRRGRCNRNPTFPSASVMADTLAMDPYGGFDIMDTDRPSLKQKKKGRRGQMPPELDDSDLNEQLHNAWEADRVKKRLKKAEREELRQQGLLGRNGKGPNLKVKYSGGITMEDVVEEIREFLVGDRQSISLPPMDARCRATIHQAAKSFELSSCSRGDGRDRFTVLSRTARTRTYTDVEFDRMMFRKGFFKRLSGPLQSKKGTGLDRAAAVRSGPRIRPQVGYRDGEKVGANAPELGPENRGHALMMKMGWSRGMALGSEENQGILHPIAHIVKTNKAGLK